MTEGVEDDRAGDLDLAHRDVPPVPAARSVSVSGSGSRAHQRSQNTRIVPGPNMSQMRCDPASSLVEAHPVSSSG